MLVRRTQPANAGHGLFVPEGFARESIVPNGFGDCKRRLWRLWRSSGFRCHSRFFRTNRQDSWGFPRSWSGGPSGARATGVPWPLWAVRLCSAGRTRPAVAQSILRVALPVSSLRRSDRSWPRGVSPWTGGDPNHRVFQLRRSEMFRLRPVRLSSPSGSDRGCPTDSRGLRRLRPWLRMAAALRLIHHARPLSPAEEKGHPSATARPAAHNDKLRPHRPPQPPHGSVVPCLGDPQRFVVRRPGRTVTKPVLR